MKKLIGFPVTWSLFWLGDLASRILRLRDTDRWAGFWYPIYNNLMISSDHVQQWAGLDGPWQELHK